MVKLPNYDVVHNQKKDKWDVRDAQQRVVKSFDTKAKATAGGVLEKLVGADGGSVKIKKMDGKIQEERTFPRSRDPKKSPG